MGEKFAVYVLQKGFGSTMHERQQEQKMLFLGFKPAVCYDIVLLFGKGRWATVASKRKIAVLTANLGQN